MKSRQITFVDGKATREEINKITGTKKGLVKICKSKGLPQSDRKINTEDEFPFGMKNAPELVIFYYIKISLILVHFQVDM